MTDEPIEAEVVETALEVPETALEVPGAAMTKVDEQMERTLKEADSVRQRAGNYVSLADAWHELREHRDPNAIILENFIDLQVAFKDHMARLASMSAKNEAKLMEMLDNEEIDDVKWATAFEKFEKVRQGNLTLATKLSNAAVRLASEHRQCLQQSKFMFHISRILEVRLAILAVLTKELHDTRIMNKIGEALEAAFNKLYPASAKSEARPRE
jgi:hypothetical protein